MCVCVWGGGGGGGGGIYVCKLAIILYNESTWCYCAAYVLNATHRRQNYSTHTHTVNLVTCT